MKLLSLTYSYILLVFTHAHRSHFCIVLVCIVLYAYIRNCTLFKLQIFALFATSFFVSSFGSTSTALLTLRCHSKGLLYPVLSGTAREACPACTQVGLGPGRTPFRGECTGTCTVHVNRDLIKWSLDDRERVYNLSLSSVYY